MFQLTPKKRVLFVRRFIPVVFVLLGVFSLAANVLQGNRHALAATQDTINFQARLETAAGAIVPDGLYNVQFKLYSASTGGSALWAETYYDSNGVTAGNDNRVTVTNGYLTVNLGSQTAFSGINWDQQLWLTMNIGGTAQTATPTYDGEMNPRLKMTAVPYAFRAGQLAQYNGVSGYSSTLSIGSPTGGNQTFVIPDQGAAGTYNLLTTATAATGFVQLQGSTPGTAQTGNLNITGTGTFGMVSLPNGTATSLGIRFASGTGIYGGTSSVNIADGYGGSIASFVSGGESSINNVSSGLAANRFRVDIGGSSSSAFLVQNTGTDLSLVRGDGTTRIKSSAPGTATLVVQGAGSQTANLFEAQNSSSTVLAKIDNTGVITGAGLQAPTLDTASAGALTIGGTNATSISIGKAGVSTTMLGALGLGTTNPQTTSALTIANSSWISAVDAAGTGYINMFQVNSANQIQVGAALNIDGGIVLPTNGGQLTFSDLPIDASASAGTPESYTMRVGSTNALTVYGESDGSGSVQNVRVAVGSSIAPAYTLDVGGDINTTGSYRINGTQICTSTGCVVSPTSGVQLQGTTPGTAQTGNFNITGTGIAGIIQATTFDTATAVSMNVGTSNATSINLNQNTYVASGKSLGVRTTAPSEALTVNGNFNVRDADTPTKQYRFRTSGSSLDLEGGGANIYISVWSAANFTGTQRNKIILESSSDNTQLIKTIQFRDSPFGTVRHTVDGTVGANVTFNSDGEATDFSVQGDTDVNLLFVQGSTDRVGIGTSTPGYKLDVNGTANATAIQAGSGGFTTSGSLVFTGTSTVNYTTPGGSNIPTRISLPNYNPGTYGQIIALGLPSTADATSRAVTILDARSVAHQPSIAVLSPNEMQIGGFSWEGTNDTFSIKNTANNISLSAAGQNVLTAKYLTSTTSSVTIGAPSSLQGSLIFANSTNNYGIVLQAGTPTGDYTIQFANAIGSANQCLSIATITGNVETLGYTNCLSSTTGVQLQGSTPGTAQTGNFNITGTGIAGSLQTSSVDTASAGTLTIGGTNATAITVTPATTFSSSLTASSAITVQGTYTTANNYRLFIGGTLNSSATSSQYGLQNQVSFNPSGASLTNIYGFVNTPILSGSSLNVSDFFGGVNSISTGAGYTGTVARATGFQVNGPTIGGSNKITQYNGIAISPNSTNGGNTSGTITNYQLRIDGISAGAGTGGTVNNTALYLTQPSGSGGTTNNYGLYIQGAGGGSSNYSIYNTSSAATYLGNSVLVKTTSSSAFQIQDASSNVFVAVDTSAGTITFGNSGNTMTIGSTGEPILAGSARHTKAIVLTPEYAGAVLDATNDAACSSANNGTMTSGYQTGISGFGNANQNYYKWTATSGTTQCYDVVIQVPVPSDWAAWTSSPMTVNGYVSSTSNGGLKATVYDSGGFLDTNWNVRAVTPGSASTWTTSSSAAFTAGGGYTAGSYMTIVVRMESKSSADTRLGNITLNYYSKY